MMSEKRTKIREYGVEIGDHKNGIMFVVEGEFCSFELNKKNSTKSIFVEQDEALQMAEWIIKKLSGITDLRPISEIELNYDI